jgi:outer membrane protein TolC
MLHGFSINQPLELPYLRKARINAAELGRVSSEYAEDESRLAVRGVVKQAFYEVLRRKREVELTRRNLQLLEDHVPTPNRTRSSRACTVAKSFVP